MGIGHSKGWYATAKEVAEKSGEQSGQVFVITGAYSGIGVETVKALLEQKAVVFVGGRREDEQKKFIESMKEQFEGASIDGAPLDLANLDSVRAFAAAVLEKHPKIDVLINNAGVMNTPPALTAQGVEQQVGINCVGHYLLAKLLIGAIEQGDAGNGKGRIVWLSSVAHSLVYAPRFNFDYFDNFDKDAADVNPWFNYQQSKLGDILLARAFAERHEVESVAVHPGVIMTGLGRYSSIFSTFAFMVANPSIVGEGVKTVQQGAATTVHAALSKEVKQGGYYADCELAVTSACADVEADIRQMYEWCEACTHKPTIEEEATKPAAEVTKPAAEAKADNDEPEPTEM